MSSPKPLPVELSPKARLDLIDILRHTAQSWGSEQIPRYRGDISKALGIISANPQVGIIRPDLPQMLRAHLVGSHVIIYRITERGIGVVRILHQRMSPGRHL